MLKARAPSPPTINVHRETAEGCICLHSDSDGKGQGSNTIRMLPGGAAWRVKAPDVKFIALLEQKRQIGATPRLSVDSEK